MTTYQYYAVYSPSWERDARLFTILRVREGEDPDLEEQCLGNGSTWRRSHFHLDQGRGGGVDRIEKVTREQARALIKQTRTLTRFIFMPMDLW